MTENDKKTGNFKVDSEVRRKFEAAVKFKGVSTNDGIEEAMKLFTDKYIVEPKK